MFSYCLGLQIFLKYILVKLMLCRLVITSDQKIRFIVDLANIISPRLDGSKERERERGVDEHEWLHPLAFWVAVLDQYALENTQTTRHS